MQLRLPACPRPGINHTYHISTRGSIGRSVDRRSKAAGKELYVEPLSQVCITAACPSTCNMWRYVTCFKRFKFNHHPCRMPWLQGLRAGYALLCSHAIILLPLQMTENWEKGPHAPLQRCLARISTNSDASAASLSHSYLRSVPPLWGRLLLFDPRGQFWRRMASR